MSEEQAKYGKEKKKISKYDFDNLQGKKIKITRSNFAEGVNKIAQSFYEGVALGMQLHGVDYWLVIEKKDHKLRMVNINRFDSIEIID